MGRDGGNMGNTLKTTLLLAVLTVLFVLVGKAIGGESGMVFAFGLAYLSNMIGLAAIVGAFAAGLILETREDKDHIKEKIKPLAELFVPIFFVSAGMLMDVRMLFNAAILVPVIVLFAIAVIGKFLAGWAAVGVKVKRHIIGIGMVLRGEVGIIFATFGLTNGVIGPDMYALLVAVVMLTTLITPVLLNLAMEGMKNGARH